VTVSSLVAQGIEAAVEGLSSDVELVSVPVDLAERAVVIVSSVPDRDPSESSAELVVVKVDARPDQTEHEHSALHAWADVAPVPRVRFFVTPGDGASDVGVLGLGWLRGDPLRATDERPWRAVGELLANLHAVPGPQAGSPPARSGIMAEAADDDDPGRLHPSHPRRRAAWGSGLVERAVELELIDADIAAAVTRVVTERERHLDEIEPCWIHGDLQTDHVLVGRGHRSTEIVGLLDVGDAGWGDPAHDLAALSLWNPELLGPILDGYGADQRRTRELEAGVGAFRPLRLLDSAIWLTTSGFVATPMVVALYEELLR